MKEKELITNRANFQETDVKINPILAELQRHNITEIIVVEEPRTNRFIFDYGEIHVDFYGRFYEDIDNEHWVIFNNGYIHHTSLSSNQLAEMKKDREILDSPLEDLDRWAALTKRYHFKSIDISVRNLKYDNQTFIDAVDYLFSLIDKPIDVFIEEKMTHFKQFEENIRMMMQRKILE